MNFSTRKIWKLHYANSLDAFVPEMWAMESVAILVENMVAASLVHRDFEPEFSNFGDVVNTRKPGEFKAKRKGANDNVTVQDATATNIAVPLDQHFHTSFMIRDGEETKSFKSLVNEYLNPAAVSLARAVDQVVLGQTYRFLENQAGSIGGLTKSNAVEYITDTGLVMNKNKAHQIGRNLIWTPEAEALLVQNPTFHEADKVGDDGTALRTASIGRKLNFQHWMAQNMSQITGSATEGSAAVNNSGGYAVGATVITVDASSTDDVAGKWISINGKVYHVASDTVSTGAGNLTLEYGLVEAVNDNDSIIIYDETAAVDAASGYAAGYDKYIDIDDAGGSQPAVDLEVGQLVTFGTQNHRYTVIDVDTDTSGTETKILLDRPLEAALSDNDNVNYGPSGGGFNFGFHRNSVTLVIRPLAAPRDGTGAISAVANLGGATMRVVITYDGDKQGHLVTLDFLAGVQVLETALGAVALS